MHSRSTDHSSLEGELTVLPFTGQSEKIAIEEAFLDLVERPGVESLLVLTRSPIGVETAEEALEGKKEKESQSRSINTLTGHAMDTLTKTNANLDLLSPSEGNAALIHFADQYSWETEYLIQASTKESFYQDLNSFVREAIKLTPLLDPDDPILTDLVTFTREFHTYLRENGYVTRPAVLRTVLDQLQESATGIDQPDAVLITEFEEFASVDRAYLSTVANDAYVHCLARREASLLRVWLETGRIGDAVDIEKTERERTNPLSLPKAVAQFLNSGSDPARTDYGEVARIHEQTFQEQLRAIGTELKYLENQGGVAYDDMAVVFRDALSPVADAVETFWNMGIPVSSTTTNGLEHDPAARELLHVAKAVAKQQEREPIPQTVNSTLKKRLRGSEHIGQLEATLNRGLPDDSKIAFNETLTKWVNETQLKARIASENDPLQSRLVFEHIESILNLATFFDETQAFDPDWETFVRTLEYEFERSASKQVATDLETQQTGVTVDTAGSLKGEEYDTVFIANVIEDEFPGDTRLNSLFPRLRASEIPGYPRIADPSWEEIDSTFAPEQPPTNSQYKAYSQLFHRRLLATAARLAERQLYFGTYEEDRNESDHIVHPSRYLEYIDEQFEGLDVFGETEENRTPERVALVEADSLFTRARRQHTSIPPDQELEERFGAIQDIIAASETDELAEAFRSRLDWTEEAIGRE